MSEPIAAEPVIVNPSPAIVTPAADPAAASLADYRKQQSAPPVEAKPPAEPVVAEPVVEADPDAEPDPASDAGKALAKHKSKLQARINELRAQAGGSEREAAALRAELAALKAGKVAEPEPAKPAIDPSKPKVENFANYEEFVEALFEWGVEQKLTAREKAAAKDDAAKSAATAQQRAQAAGIAAHADFDETIGAFVDAGHQFSPVVAEAVLGHELGHEIGYALAKDPAEHARIAALPPGAQYVEIGKLIARLEAAAVPAPAPKPAPVTKAPAPVKPVGGSAATAVPDPKNITSVREYRKHRDHFVGN